MRMRRAMTTARPTTDPTAGASPSVLKAAKSDLLWELSTVEAMERFALRHAEVIHARQIAMLTRPPAEIVAAQKRRQTQRLREKVVRSEAAYPGILHLLQTTTSADVGERYGFSRARANMILSNLRELATDTGTSVEAAAKSVIEDARRMAKSAR